MRAILLSILLLVSAQAMATGSSFCTFENDDIKVTANLTISGGPDAGLVAPSNIDIEFKSWAYPVGIKYASMGPGEIKDWWPFDTGFMKLFAVLDVATEGAGVEVTMMIDGDINNPDFRVEQNVSAGATHINQFYVNKLKCVNDDSN